MKYFARNSIVKLKKDGNSKAHGRIIKIHGDWKNDLHTFDIKYTEKDGSTHLLKRIKPEAIRYLTNFEESQL